MIEIKKTISGYWTMFVSKELDDDGVFEQAVAILLGWADPVEID